MFDVVIVGAGPAGLSAALVLGRCRRQVLICDAGTPRNGRSRGLHGYLTRDGVPPVEFLRIGREELRPYGIEPQHSIVTEVARADGGFEVLFEDGARAQTRMVLIATGVRDHLPDIPGLADCYGISAHHCPYCDGWEVRDRVIAVIGDGSTSPAPLALSLRTWSDRVLACTNGRARLRAKHREQLEALAIPVYRERIDRVQHEDGRVTHLVLDHGESVACDAIFFAAPQSQQCELARRLGCEFTRRGTVKTDHLGHTCVTGIYVAGDASRDVQFVVVAAAEGAKAGVAINKALQARAGLTT